MSKKPHTVLITGGAGYVGAVLVPKLIKKGYKVKVIDLYLFGDNLWPELDHHSNLEQHKGDIRDQVLLREILPDCDSVVHLACISNDPSFELDPELGKSINFDAFEPLVRISKESGVRRFIYASSSSVYGVSKVPNVDEDHPLVPLTDYSKFKSLCEPILLDQQSKDFIPFILRPATVCGYSPRQRMDLSVNILTNHAVNNGRITVFGGKQMRPNINIQDMTDLYLMLLELPELKISGKIYNAGYQNHTVMELAMMAQKVVEADYFEGKKKIEIVTTPTDDVRSYHISSEKIKKDLGFIPKFTVEDAIRELVNAFKAGKLPNSMTDPRYFNIKTMQQLQLT